MKNKVEKKIVPNYDAFPTNKFVYPKVTRISKLCERSVLGLLCSKDTISIPLFVFVDIQKYKTFE